MTIPKSLSDLFMHTEQRNTALRITDRDRLIKCIKSWVYIFGREEMGAKKRDGIQSKKRTNPPIFPPVFLAFHMSG